MIFFKDHSQSVGDGHWWPRIIIISVLAIGLGMMIFAGLVFGARELTLSEVWNALRGHESESIASITVNSLRLPRVLVGIVVGIALAVAGLLIQNITNNGLADPGILGINAGASTAVVIGIWAFGFSSSFDLGWLSIIGASVAIIIVMLIGFSGARHASPIKLILAGAAMTAIFSSITSSILFLADETINVFRHWIVGSLSSGGNTRLLQLTGFLPLLLIGMFISIFVLRGLDVLQLGEDTALALGVSLQQIRFLGIVAIVLLAASATAIAGPIGFLGLATPHVARALMGASMIWRFAACLFLGPILLLGADIIGRLLLQSGEIQVGVVIVFIGVPVFLSVVRYSKELII